MRIAQPMPTLCTSLRILLAEDNRINQRYAVALLEKLGHTVDIASNGVVAVEAVLHADYDIVLMDIQMPELDGIAATKQIRAGGTEMPHSHRRRDCERNERIESGIFGSRNGRLYFEAV